MKTVRRQQQQHLQHTVADTLALLLQQQRVWLCTAWTPRRAAPGDGAARVLHLQGAVSAQGAGAAGAEAEVPAQGVAARRPRPGGESLTCQTAMMMRSLTLVMKTGVTARRLESFLISQLEWLYNVARP